MCMLYSTAGIPAPSGGSLSIRPYRLTAKAFSDAGKRRFQPLSRPDIHFGQFFYRVRMIMDKYRICLPVRNARPDTAEQVEPFPSSFTGRKGTAAQRSSGFADRQKLRVFPCPRILLCVSPVSAAAPVQKLILLLPPFSLPPGAAPGNTVIRVQGVAVGAAFRADFLSAVLRFLMIEPHFFFKTALLYHTAEFQPPGAKPFPAISFPFLFCLFAGKRHHFYRHFYLSTFYSLFFPKAALAASQPSPPVCRSSSSAS